MAGSDILYKGVRKVLSNICRYLNQVMDKTIQISQDERSRESEWKYKSNEADVCLVFSRNSKEKSMVTVSERERSRRHSQRFAR